MAFVDAVSVPYFERIFIAYVKEGYHSTEAKECGY